MKRLISVLLSGAMLATGSSLAFAEHGHSDSLMEYFKASTEYTVQEARKNPEVELLKLKTPSGDLVEITAKHNLDGSNFYTFSEGNLTNAVYATSEGELYLDSKKVEVYKDGLNFLDQPGIGALRAHRKYVTQTCPYGSPSDYTILREDTGKISIELRQDIASIAKSTFVGLICAAFGIPTALSIAASTLYSVYDRAKNRDPHARAMGGWFRKYIHKSGNFPGDGYIFKRVVSLYYDKGCTSLIDTCTDYEVFET